MEKPHTKNQRSPDELAIDVEKASSQVLHALDDLQRQNREEEAKAALEKQLRRIVAYVSVTSAVLILGIIAHMLGV